MSEVAAAILATDAAKKIVLPVINQINIHKHNQKPFAQTCRPSLLNFIEKDSSVATISLESNDADIKRIKQ